MSNFRIFGGTLIKFNKSTIGSKIKPCKFSDFSGLHPWGMQQRRLLVISTLMVNTRLK
jgi:hypothetical protein